MRKYTHACTFPLVSAGVLLYRSSAEILDMTGLGAYDDNDGSYRIVLGTNEVATIAEPLSVDPETGEVKNVKQSFKM